MARKATDNLMEPCARQTWRDRHGWSERPQKFFEGISSCRAQHWQHACSKPKAYYMEVLLLGNPYLDRWGGRENPDYPDYTNPNRRNVQADIFNLVYSFNASHAVDYNARYNL